MITFLGLVFYSVDLSIGDFVFEFDHVDLECDRNVIMDIYYHALKGYDIVSASPTQKEKFTSKLFYGVFDIKLKYKISYRQIYTGIHGKFQTVEVTHIYD